MSASCDDPGTIAQGRKIGNDYSHGQMVTYECITQGYSLVGNPTLTCNDGSWDSQRPQCKGKCFVLYLLIRKQVIMLSSDTVYSRDPDTIKCPCPSTRSRPCTWQNVCSRRFPEIIVLGHRIRAPSVNIALDISDNISGKHAILCEGWHSVVYVMTPSFSVF